MGKKILIPLEEFGKYKTILSNLRNDSQKFIQKSVGNNLNDLFKDAPKKAWEIINEWQKEEMSKETKWIIKHGTRNL